MIFVGCAHDKKRAEGHYVLNKKARRYLEAPDKAPQRDPTE
jgi:hypothetical protein